MGAELAPAYAFRTVPFARASRGEAKGGGLLEASMSLPIRAFRFPGHRSLPVLCAALAALALALPGAARADSWRGKHSRKHHHHGFQSGHGWQYGPSGHGWGYGRNGYVGPGFRSHARPRGRDCDDDGFVHRRYYAPPSRYRGPRPGGWWGAPRGRSGIDVDGAVVIRIGD